MLCILGSLLARQSYRVSWTGHGQLLRSMTEATGSPCHNEETKTQDDDDTDAEHQDANEDA